MKRTIPTLALIGLLSVGSLAACTSQNPGTPSTTGSPTAPAYVTDGTVTISQVTDPGALDPQMSIVSGEVDMAGYAYDYLVTQNSQGEIESNLAKSWTYEGQTATFVLNDGITCSDGSALTAQTVADNVNWVEDVNNSSPLLGTFVPAGTVATADNATNTVTLTLSQPAPFLLSGLSVLPIVCDAGLADRSKLQEGTLGSGPYVLTEAVPNDHYTYERRDGYTWGPNGATTATPGLPKTIVVKIVPNESTAVNLLLAGQVNITLTTTSDGDRAAAANLNSIDIPAILGLTWYNHASGHPTADAAVRKALTQAVNLDQLTQVITANTGSRATEMSVLPPAPCQYDAATGNIAAFDSAGAGATLEADGYTKGSDGMYAKDGQPLTVTFLYDSAMGTPAQAAAELAQQQWQAAGITVKMSSYDTAQLSGILFGTGDWDVTWEPLNVNSPDQWVSFLSGPGLADGGSNFSSIDNADYSASVTQAMAQTGTDSCTYFQQAESALFKNSDIIAWAVRPNKLWLNKVEYEYIGRTQVMSLRVLA